MTTNYPKILQTRVVLNRTILFIDLVNFTEQSALMDAAGVGSRVAGFYEHVKSAGVRHNVRLVECRGDCCICKACDSGMVTRMLAFARDVYSVISGVRMGMATGDVVFLTGSPGQSMASFMAVQGDVVNTAARMQSKSSPSHEGVLMHISSVTAWVAETGRSCEELLFVHCKGKGAQSSAFYSCRVDEFVSLPEWGLSVQIDEEPLSPHPCYMPKPLQHSKSDLSLMLRPKHPNAFSVLCSSSATFSERVSSAVEVEGIQVFSETKRPPSRCGRGEINSCVPTELPIMSKHVFEQEVS